MHICIHTLYAYRIPLCDEGERVIGTVPGPNLDEFAVAPFDGGSEHGVYSALELRGPPARRLSEGRETRLEVK